MKKPRIPDNPSTLGFLAFDTEGFSLRELMEAKDEAMREVVAEVVAPKRKKRTQAAAQEYWDANLPEMTRLVCEKLRAKGIECIVW